MIKNLDEIVFEGRNKSYGAYAMRKRYKRIVANALFVSVVVFSLIWGGILLYYYLHDESKVSDSTLMATYDMMSMYGDMIEVPPPDVPDQKQEQETMIPKTEKDVVPVVTQEEVKPIIKKDKKIENEIDSANGDHAAIKGIPGMGSDSAGLYTRVEKRPDFPGGITALHKFLRDNIKYPKIAIDKKIAGVVHVSFIIRPTGGVDRVVVTKSVDPQIDAEAIRVVKMMPLWSPGKQHGRPVSVYLTLPIRFLPAS